MATSDFATNLCYAMQQRRLQVGDFADETGINRTTLSKMRTGERTATPKQSDTLEKLLGLRIGDLSLAHAEFVRKWKIQNSTSNLVLASFRAIKENNRRWEAISRKYKGDYLVYYPQNEPGKVICSYLKIGDVRSDGIETWFVNPHVSHVLEKTYYEYFGYMHALSNILYFIFEQEHNDYEVLTISAYDSPTPKPELILGMLTGIGVINNNSHIAARSVVIHRQRSPVRNWQTEMKNRIIYADLNQVPTIVQKHLSHEKITINYKAAV